MITNNIGTSACQHQFFSQARTSLAADLGATERKTLSLQVLTRTEPVTRLAQGYQVSRKFLYQQAAEAQQALNRAFSPSPTDKSVIFHLPITKDWIRQFVLSQVLIGHSSSRAVIEIFHTVFDYRGISIGTVHNIVNSAVQKAKLINQAETLSAISIAAHDEIYQAGKPAVSTISTRTGSRTGSTSGSSRSCCSAGRNERAAWTTVPWQCSVQSRIQRCPKFLFLKTRCTPCRSRRRSGCSARR